MDHESGRSVESGQDIEMGQIMEWTRSMESGRSTGSRRHKDTSQGCGVNSERGLFLFYVGCVVIGCFYAFIVKSIDFSKFEVGTRVVIDDVGAREVHLHLCAPTEQVFDERKYNEKARLKIVLKLNSKEDSEQSRKRLLSQVTTKDLLEFTPKVDEIFASCRLRQTKSDHDGIRDLVGKECNEWFKVFKYLSNSNFCLRIVLPSWQGLLRYIDVAFDPFAVGIIRSITLNDTLFEKVTSFKAFYTLGNSPGFKELMAAPSIDRGYDYSSRSTFYNQFGMRYQVVTETNVMEWPHRTCYDDRSKEEELAMCLSKQIKETFQKRSPMALIKKGDNLTILSDSVFHDDWEKKEWKNIVNKCHEMTDHIKECKDVRVVTTVDERLAGQGTNLTIVELVPAAESFEYIHEPKMDIQSFLLLIGAILSTGFGFSLYTWRGCRWNRFKKHGRCWYFGFKSKIEDPEAKRVTQVVDEQKTDRELIVQLMENNAILNVEVRKINQTLLQVIPLRTEIKTLRTEIKTGLDKMKKKKVDKHDLDKMFARYSSR